MFEWTYSAVIIMLVCIDGPYPLRYKDVLQPFTGCAYIRHGPCPFPLLGSSFPFFFVSEDFFCVADWTRYYERHLLGARRGDLWLNLTGVES
jgi:hypothetical protein